MVPVTVKGIKNRRLAQMLVALVALNAVQVHADEYDGGKGWFLAALIPTLGNTLIAALNQGAGCVFSNFLNKLGVGAGPSYNCNNNAVAINNAPMNGQFNAPMNAQFTPQAAAFVSTQPVLSFVVQRLSSNAPNAQVLDVISSAPLAQGSEPSFTIHTGESFAIAFSTTVPGRVRLINTDADGQVTPSSLYEAIPGGDNRMPRLHEGGILMTGRSGVEYLDVEFVPCISQSLSQHPSVAPFINSLPACTNEAATKQYRPALPSGKGGVADFGGKAMSFPASADPSQPIAIAPSNYAKGEMLRFRLRIDHVAPADGNAPADPRV